MLGLVDRPDGVVVADLEAGIGTLVRMADGAVDVAVVVVEATTKSIEVARRLLELAGERRVPQLAVVANRIREDADLSRVGATLRSATGAELPTYAVPDDPALVDCDRAGVAPLDAAPQAPAVRALVAAAEALLSGLPRR